MGAGGEGCQAAAALIGQRDLVSSLTASLSQGPKGMPSRVYWLDGPVYCLDMTTKFIGVI